MKEDFLHYLWKFKKFDFLDLKTSNGEVVTIIHCGEYIQKAGPDFFNAQIIIGNQKWAGNVEIHIKSSDWYVHHHERDEGYENVILHVVWEHDTEIYAKNNTEIPVLVLQNYVSKTVLENYKALTNPKSWIFCEKQITFVNSFVFNNWQERLFFERLERKSKPIQDLLQSTNQDWETVLFCLLAKNFGLNTNGELFFEIAQNISFAIIRKEGFELENLEALLFGFAGFLETEREDTYHKDLKFRFYYLLQKYQLERKHIDPVQFFQHRPDNFPTIRLSQLANLYFNQQNLFSKLIGTTALNTIYELLAVSVSDYWQTHYQFDKISPKKKKALSKSFIDLIVINTIVPIQFAYAKSKNKDISEDLIFLLSQVAPESNTIIQKFATFGIKSKTAFDTQSLLQLKNEYCNKSQCLSCAVGAELLSGK